MWDIFVGHSQVAGAHRSLVESTFCASEGNECNEKHFSREINRLTVKCPFLLNGREQVYPGEPEQLLGMWVSSALMPPTSCRLGKIEELNATGKLGVCGRASLSDAGEEASQGGALGLRDHSENEC